MEKPFLLVVGYLHDEDEGVTDGWRGFYPTEQEAESKICIHIDKRGNNRFTVKDSNEDLEPHNYYEWYDIIDVRKFGAE